MKHRSFVVVATLMMLTAVICLPSLAAKKSDYAVSSYAKYVQIPGATQMGSETCTACHEDVSKDFRHAFHAQQGVTCEECHGPGSLHVEGGGDVAKIVSFKKRSVTESNGACLSCHAQGAQVRHWLTGAHAANHVRCTECHQVHQQAVQAANETFITFDTATRAAFAASAVSPETNVIVRRPSVKNDACLKCHATQRAEISMPYHHPLREGKMSCMDCHDPHGGPAGNNLRSGNINQLCLSCHAQYRGPFAYQHPPVAENCLLCHTAHGSPNTNLLSVSMPALCLQCHSGHHNGAGLPLSDRCTNCHRSIHGTDVPTPSGGSRFVDKGPSEADLLASARSAAQIHGVTGSSHPAVSARSNAALPGGQGAGFGTATLSPSLAAALGVFPSFPENPDWIDQKTEEPVPVYSSTSITPASYRLIDGSGFLGRVGEYDSLRQSAGGDAVSAYVSPNNHLTVVSRANLLSGSDYSAGSQLTAGEWVQIALNIRSFVQQQDTYPFYAFPVLDIPPGDTVPPDTTTISIPTGATFGVTRRLGDVHARIKVPRLPVRLYVDGNWQARSGLTQLGYLDENTTPAVFVGGVNTTCGQQCHFNSQFQSVNYTTRNVGGGAEASLGKVHLAWQHIFSSFNDRLTFPIGIFTGPFTPANEGISAINPPPSGPFPPDVAAGNYFIDIPPPSQSSSDSVDLNWTASDTLALNGSASYTRLRDIFTRHPQNQFASNDSLHWRPWNRLQLIAEYSQYNQINDFTPFYSLYGNVSYHDHAEGLRLDYALPGGYDVEGYYRRRGITRSNAFLWPQVYSINNTDLLDVVPSSFSNTTGLTLRYHDRGHWSGRAGYEWTGTHQPGYLIVPQSNNRIFANLWITPTQSLTFTNDVSIILQNAFPAIALPNLPGDFQRRNRFYAETATATLNLVPGWRLGLGYSYLQNNLRTYMAFQNDSAVGYVINDPAVPFKQITQAYWGESTYMVGRHLGLNGRLTYNSSRSGMRPDTNPNDAALLGNQALISQGAFDPDGLFPSALGNLQFASTQISQVIVPQWIGESKAYYLFPHRFEAGVIFYYGSYRDDLNPRLNGVLRTFNVYAGRSW